MENKNSKVRSYYDSFAESYDQVYERIQLDKYKQIDELIEDLASTGWICDLGGGTGLFSIWLNRQCINLDISIEMLQLGLKQGRDYYAIQGTLEKLPFRNTCIDTLFSFTALQNSGNQLATIEEIERILDHETSAIITSLKKKTNTELLELSFREKGLQFTLRPFGGEDYIYLISKLASRSSISSIS